MWLDATSTHPPVIWLNDPDTGGLESLVQLKTVARLKAPATCAGGQILRRC